jgi:prepilin-type N-terminal cleavage/methylation domain-containing protein
MTEITILNRKPELMFFRVKHKQFTLIELLVVIAIIAIPFSITGYSCITD